jgi:hypothetical protein
MYQNALASTGTMRVLDLASLQKVVGNTNTASGCCRKQKKLCQMLRHFLCSFQSPQKVRGASSWRPL